MLPFGYSYGGERNLARHFQGFKDAEGTPIPVDPTEDDVVSIWLTYLENPPQPRARNMKLLLMSDPELIAERMLEFANYMWVGHHDGGQYDPVFFMSTGRCGTMSMHQLLQGSRLRPYHSYWWMLPSTEHIEFVARMLNRKAASARVVTNWIETRAAEWLAGPIAMINHTDICRAPAPTNWEEEDMIHWYVTSVNNYADGMRMAYPERTKRIYADLLFQQNEAEIKKLLDWCEVDIPLEDAKAHFSRKINEKAHKVVRD